MGSGEREKGDSREGGRRAKGGRVERGGAESVSWRARSMSWERPRRPRLGTTFVSSDPKWGKGVRRCKGVCVRRRVRPPPTSATRRAPIFHHRTEHAAAREGVIAMTFFARVRGARLCTKQNGWRKR